MATSPTGVRILKSDGNEDMFDQGKLEESLVRAGAGTFNARRIAERVAAQIVPGTRTADIYKRAFSLLRREARTAAARYSLRRALFELGPTGHPFEDFVGNLFALQGWKVERRKIAEGRCVPHELDLYATRGNETLAAELKYHNDPGYKTDVKVALYVKARFDDIWKCDPTKRSCPVDRGFLITNTKFTSHALAYAQCAGIELIGWSYPAKGNLYDMIIETGAYPITALTTLKKAEKRLLIDKGIVSCDLLLKNRGVLRELAFTPEHAGEALAESAGLGAPYDHA